MLEISPRYRFEGLISPLTIAKFVDEYFGRQILVLRRQAPDYYDELISIEMLDEFLTIRRPRHSRVFAVDARREISSKDYTLTDERIDVARLYRLFSEGATITFRQMQDLLPQFATMCRGAEQFFNCPFQTNLYLTPPNGQGFATHHETHDVFILQVSGSKRWRIYDPVIRLPLLGQVFEGNEDRLGPVTQEFTLHAGDLFYCPRGVPHDAQTTDQTSLHITFGAMVYSWAEVMVEAIADVSLNDEAFRANLPVGFATGRVAQAELEVPFRALVERFAQSARLAPAIAGIADEFVSSRSPILPDQRNQAVGVASLTANSWVGCRPGLIYRFSESGERVTLQCFSTEMSVPGHAASALKFALENPLFRIGDMPGALDSEGKLTLIRRLIGEGFVVALRPQA
jgi:ribosomal protein L16 Arg81 hydroxylase